MSSGQATTCHRRTQALGLVAVFAGLLVSSSSAIAQEQVTEVRRFGTSNAFHRPGVHTAEDLQALFTNNRADIEKVLRDAGWKGNPEDVFRAVAEGSFGDARHPKGTNFQWMAVRKRGEPSVTQRLVYAGDEPFDAFEVRITSNCSTYRLLVPKACGNLAMLSETPISAPSAPSLRLQQASSCSGARVTVDASIPGMTDETRLEMTLTRPDGSQETINPQAAGGGYRWESTLDAAGSYSVSAVAIGACGRSQTVTERLSLAPCFGNCSIGVTPPMGEKPKLGEDSLGIDLSGSSAQMGSLTSASVSVYHEDQLVDTLNVSDPWQAQYTPTAYGNYRFTAKVTDDRGLQSQNACEATYLWAEPPPKKIWPVASLGVGLERRWRHGAVEDVQAAAQLGEEFVFDRSAFVVTPTGGVIIPTSDKFGILAQLGVEINTRDSDNSSLFADVGAQFFMDGGFIGAGVGIWDINHGLTRTGTIFAHGGVDVTHRIQWFIEGRLFTNMLSMIDNNYYGVTGIRFIWRPED